MDWVCTKGSVGHIVHTICSSLTFDISAPVSFPSLTPIANAMGRIGGITSPFIISESTSLRTIGIVMCLVSTVTSMVTCCLPETAGIALGDIDGGRSSRSIKKDQATPPRLGFTSDPGAEKNGSEYYDDDHDDFADAGSDDTSSFELL
jgi:hypothetical protein